MGVVRPRSPILSQEVGTSGGDMIIAGQQNGWAKCTSVSSLAGHTLSQSSKGSALMQQNVLLPAYHTPQSQSQLATLFS